MDHVCPIDEDYSIEKLGFEEALLEMQNLIDGGLMSHPPKSKL